MRQTNLGYTDIVAPIAGKIGRTTSAKQAPSCS
jgi:multidrug efflux pump subunit AcrA (membrane-fusion protein)